MNQFIKDDFRTEFLADPLVHAHANLKSVTSASRKVFSSAKGIRLTDSKGKEYIDGLAGMWCVGLGYGNEIIENAIIEQVKALPYYPIFGEKCNDRALELSSQLSEILPGNLNHLFFVNSGSEANDSALKLAWYYQNALGRPQKKIVLTFDRAYHGSTIAAASLTALNHMHTSFNLPAFRVERIKSPDNLLLDSQIAIREYLESFERTIKEIGSDNICCMFAEPILGAGGLVIPPVDLWKKVHQILKENNILLIADEVISGFGRTGKMFGAELFDVVPDMVTMAKNLSSGYQPIGAIGISSKLMEIFERESDRIGTFAMGMTYSGHPVACAASVACLSQYKESDFLPHVNSIGHYLHSRLTTTVDVLGLDNLRSVGLLAAVDVPNSHSASAKQIVDSALEKGLILRSLGDTIVFCPPFVSSIPDIDEMISIFEMGAAQ